MEALLAADPYIMIPGEPATEGGPPQMRTMSSAIFDMTAYTALNDSILDRIQVR